MKSYRRKKFFIKDNFQIVFIIGFTLLLLLEVVAASSLIYILSEKAVENAAFNSHIIIDSSEQIIKPVILKVNIYFVLTSLLLAGIIVVISYLKLHLLFAKILTGIENLKYHNTSFRLDLNSGRNTRELINEFNQAASGLDKRQTDLIALLDSLLAEKNLMEVKKLHKKLFFIISENN